MKEKKPSAQKGLLPGRLLQSWTLPASVCQDSSGPCTRLEAAPSPGWDPVTSYHTNRRTHPESTQGQTLSPQKCLPWQQGVRRCATPPASLLFSLEGSLPQLWGHCCPGLCGRSHQEARMLLPMPSLVCVLTGKERKLCKSKCPASLLPEKSPEV